MAKRNSSRWRFRIGLLLLLAGGAWGWRRYGDRWFGAPQTDSDAMASSASNGRRDESSSQGPSEKINRVQPDDLKLSIPARATQSDGAAAEGDETIGGGSAGDPPQNGVMNLVEEGRGLMGKGAWLAARAKLNAALNGTTDVALTEELRRDLTRISAETIFSSQVAEGDTLAEYYNVVSGDTLDRIAKRFSISSQFLARINNIANMNVIRLGQRLKVVHGPVHLRVSKSRFQMDVFLQDVYLKSFPVGLGADGSTPTGEWEVADKLVNPVYYPARGGKIIQADNPENPLGERWIGLKGISGEAEGQMRYGIHGTIEPDSIGKNVSLGCVRLHNADVEFVYDLVISGASRVTVVP